MPGTINRLVIKGSNAAGQSTETCPQGRFTMKDKPETVVNIDSKIRALAFLPGERPRIVSCEETAIQLRRLEDNLMGDEFEPRPGVQVLAVAASKHGDRVVTGATNGLTIWDAGGERPTVVEHHAIEGVRTIDISSDSKWVVTGSDARTADVWDLSTGKKHPSLGPLKHEYNVVAVKFCPCGRRIATATLFGSIRIFSVELGKKILTIPAMVMSTFFASGPSAPGLPASNITLAWFADAKRPQLFAISEGQIKRLDAKDGLIIYQWPLRGIRHHSSVILSPNNKLIAYCLNQTVVLRDLASGEQLGDALEHDGNVSCITFSPGSDYLAAGVDTKFVIWNLRERLTNTSYFDETTTDYAKWCAHYKQDTVPDLPPTTYPLPLMSITNAAVKPWLHSYLDSAEEVLTEEMKDPAKRNADMYANRAIIRGRRGNGSGALEDANKSLSIRQSALGQIAKAIAMICQGNYESAKQEIPAVLKAGHSAEQTFLLEVIQSILFCMLGKYDEGISRVGGLKGDQKLQLLVQANMHLSNEKFDTAMESFKKARVPIMFPYDESREMWTISFIFGWKFSGLGFQIQQKKCESLLKDGKSEAADLFCKVKDTYQREIATHAKLSTWTLDFGKRCLEKLRKLGDEALESKAFETAIRHYKAVEPLIGVPDWKFELLLKRSEAYVGLGLEKWMEALQDADEAIRINRYVPWGYDKRHEALYLHRDYHEAAEALDKMVFEITVARDDKSTELREKGVQPMETRKIVKVVVEDALTQPRPHLLLNTKSGCLCDKPKQAEAFLADPIYKRLILSPTSQVVEDTTWKASIHKYFRYSTFSHTWEEEGEPEFCDVDKRPIEKLMESFPNKKLQNFCAKSHDHGYWWAWSDTCCINKENKEVLNVSLRSMYRWYSESSLTIVHLKGVLGQLEDAVDTFLEFLDQLKASMPKDSMQYEQDDYRWYFEPFLRARITECNGVYGELKVDVDTLKNLLDALEAFTKCRWNQRAWTLQEYFASKAIHFYTEDWNPYLPILPHRADTGLTRTNHKTHRAIQRGMELVTRLNAVRLAALKPGSEDAREKLRLASPRNAKQKEDIAYSLLGIFKVTIETIYGADEVPRALGRLLGALLTQSADVTILAWTGDPSEYNTCLPAKLTVYEEKEYLHVPRAIEDAELVPSSPITPSSLSSTRIDSAIKLHENLLKLPPPDLHQGRLTLPCICFRVESVQQGPNSGSYTVTVPLLGTVELKASDDLYSPDNMILVHPWFRRLLDPGISLSESARYKCALRLLAALRQPFGALLLVLNQATQFYRRICTDQLITVQIKEDVSLEQLLENTRTLHIR